MVIACLPSCCAPSRSASASPLPGKYFPSCFHIFLHITLVSSNSCPRVRLSHPASTRPSYTPELSPMLTHERLSFLPLSAIDDRDGVAAVCLRLPLVQAVRHVGLAGFEPSTLSGALRVDQVTRAASRSRLQSLALPYPRFGSSEFGPARAGRQLGRVCPVVSTKLV